MIHSCGDANPTALAAAPAANNDSAKKDLMLK
jgi:hypothetical protein